ncbi:MAG: hypothetical protein HC830_09330, partial [Bacteroidetes bacterium]|nr:hypothetical protein [Bacteroidota bacterium]
MHKIAFFLFSFLSVAAFSQTNTYSPYSRYGLGDLSSQGLVSNKGMGGTGIGLRLPNSLNYLNPASYTTQDSLSFLFDFGLFSQVTDYKSKSGSGTDVNASLGHIVFGFPVTRWWNSAIGIVPYSRMGYDLVNYNSLFVYNYKGSGGLNKFFVGNGFRIKNLSVGVNLNVLFGSLEQSHSYMNEDETRVPVFPTERFQQQSVRSTSLAFGFQYNIKLSDDFSVVLGGILENKSRLITRNSLLITNTYSSVDTFINPFTGSIYGERTSIDTIDFYNERKVEEHLPLLYGAGISLNYKKQIFICIWLKR